MAYDRYVAICNPLHYPLVMNQKICIQLAVGAWIGGIPVQVGQTCQIFSLRFCNSNQINHFFCDIPPILKLACGNTFIHEFLVYVVAVLFAAIPFIMILASYSKIISTILRLPTATGRTKAFSTCSSHLVVVVLFYGTVTIAYLRPKSNQTFWVFIIVYIIILMGNSLIIVLTRLDPALQKPMYFFLANFSSLEICYVSVTLPRILMDLWTQDRSISMLDCATQMCFFLILGATECLLLAVMAYDRYVAICNPLHYPLVMNQNMCIRLAIGAWISGIPIQVTQTCEIFSLHFCKSNQINHFFCDIPAILKLGCGNTSIPEILVCFVAVSFIAIPFTLILASYCKIVSTILQLPTATGRVKAFSTCSSHLLVVVLFYGTSTISYLRPKSNQTAGMDKLLSLFYTIVTPMFNPMIYSLRNKDVITALRKLLLKKTV
ncbi:Olfactory receptor 10AG1 [Pteropus alecto]|uniref:Olfactory receptor 10AG1 n=1 Tax=Pteropus alecto TaxID=9402 RepID=L5KYR9_PTEAL|nr:Olfactory receptor 10AG1 [Pteropus alecto]